MSSQLSLSISGPQSSLIDGLFIEQEESGQTDGKLSRAGMLNAISGLLNIGFIPAPVCDEECGVVVNVYKADPGLNYTFGVSHGIFGKGQTMDFIHTEKVTFSMTDSGRLTYPNRGVISKKWLGDRVWNKDAARLDHAAISVDGQGVKTDQIVYGTAIIKYKSSRDQYRVIIPPREVAEENKYSCVAYAHYTGGVKWEVLTPPEGVEDLDLVCTGGGGSFSIGDDEDDDKPPYAPNTNATKEIDYCDQEVISEP